MRWYCEKCKVVHNDNELCPRIKSQLKNNPGLLKEVADFATVTGEEVLITSQALDGVAKGINKVLGTNLSYEGTQQYARDIEVFKRLDVERFSKVGAFRTPEAAKTYLENATKGQLQNIKTNLNGMGQEVDWLRDQQGKISALLKKSNLYTKNKAGVDGKSVFRFNKDMITKTSIKAAESKSGINTNVQDIIKALKKGTLNPNDSVCGVKGTETALKNKLDKEISYALSKGDNKTAELLKNAKAQLKITEQGTTDSVKNSTDRLTKKIAEGKATTSVTAQQVGKQIAQGAVVGAVIAITISTITSYMRYKNGELTKEEAFSQVSEDTIKGAIVGGAMGAITIFLPTGAIGFVVGMAIGIYVNKACENILDEIYGKGAYGAILNASGYVYGMTVNLVDYYEKINNNNKIVRKNIEEADSYRERINKNFERFEQMKER